MWVIWDRATDHLHFYSEEGDRRTGNYEDAWVPPSKATHYPTEEEAAAVLSELIGGRWACSKDKVIPLREAIRMAVLKELKSCG